jgi:uncharacterized protein YndB with AHSA1/START domain
MTKNTVSEIERMVVTRIFDAPRELAWKAWTVFDDLGNGQTKLTFIGNEPMESAKDSGQMEGWNQILDKVAAVITGLAQAKLQL